METSFQTSFIPKKPIAVVTTPRGGSTSIVSLLSIILLVGSGLVAGGFFLYKNYLTHQEELLSASLTKVSTSFDKDTIAELELFDKRSMVSKQILNNHIVLSPLFALLGDLTIPSVQYTRFEHQLDEKGFSVKMAGIARDYKSIALQAESFNSAKGRLLKNVVFSNLTKDASNNVSFNVEFTVDPSLLSYQKNAVLEAKQGALQSEIPPDTSVPQASDTPPQNPIVPNPTTPH